MNARLMAVSAVGGFILAALMLSPPTSAQTGSSKTFFSSLRVGQMVEFTADAWGAVIIRTYDDPDYKAAMKHRVKDIGPDYLTVEFTDTEGTGAVADYRVPVYRFSLISHLGKATRKSDAGPDAGAPTKPDTKKKKR